QPCNAPAAISAATQAGTRKRLEADIDPQRDEAPQEHGIFRQIAAQRERREARLEEQAAARAERNQERRARHAAEQRFGRHGARDACVRAESAVEPARITHFAADATTLLELDRRAKAEPLQRILVV